MNRKVQTARVAVVLIEPVAVPPRCGSLPPEIKPKNSVNGMQPSTLQNAMKKKTVQRNGTKMSVCSFNAGRKTSIRKYSRIDSKKLRAPRGGELSARLNSLGNISSIKM